MKSNARIKRIFEKEEKQTNDGENDVEIVENVSTNPSTMNTISSMAQFYKAFGKCDKLKLRDLFRKVARHKPDTALSLSEFPLFLKEKFNESFGISIFSLGQDDANLSGPFSFLVCPKSDNKTGISENLFFDEAQTENTKLDFKKKLIEKERLRTSLSRIYQLIKEDFGSSMLERFQCFVRKLRRAFRESVFLLSIPKISHILSETFDNREQVGFIRDCRIILEEISTFDLLEVTLINIAYSGYLKRMREVCFVRSIASFEYFIGEDGNLSLRFIFPFVIITDGSELRRNLYSEKFVGGYLRSFFVCNPLKNCHLRPFLFLKKELNFFETISAYGRSFESLLSMCENYLKGN